MKRVFSLLLALLMVASVFTLVACGNDQQSDTPSTPDTPDAPDMPDAPDAPDDPEQPTNARLPLDLPDQYYGGDEPFHILEWTANSNYDGGTAWLPWHEGDATEEDTDLLGTAVFARNAYVEEQYGVVITQEYVNVNGGANVQRLLTDNQTGENGIQLTTTRGFEAWALVESGLLTDMNQFAGDILHTDKPWWVQDAVASFTLGDSLYLCATEMQLRDKGATSLVFYNTKIAEDYGLGNLFELAENGDWTFEAMISACDVVAGDRDGDGIVNSRADMWGVTSQDDASFMLYAGAGFKFAEINEDGYLEYQFGSKDSILTMQEIFEDVMYADWFLNGTINPLPGEGGGFGENLAFIVFSLAKSAYIDLREEDISFGVLPCPKYDENQDDYCSLVWMHHDSALGIPSGATDPEMCAIILEALSYEGYYTVTPVLYDTLLYNRLAKTEEARRGFEIVFATRVYDPGQFWDTVQGFTDKVLRHTATGNAGIATLWKEHESAVNVHVQNVNDFIDETR